MSDWLPRKAALLCLAGLLSLLVVTIPAAGSGSTGGDGTVGEYSVTASKPPGSVGPLTGASTAQVSAAARDPEAALRLFADADRLEQQGDAAAAIRNLELLVAQFSSASLADDALLRVAQLRWVLGQTTEARQAIAQLKTNYPRSAGAAGSFILEGDIRVAEAAGNDDLNGALESYRNVVLLYSRSDFPVLEARAEALVRAGDAAALLGEPETAGAHYLQAIEAEPDGLWTATARLRLGELLIRDTGESLGLGEWRAGALMLQRVVDDAAPVTAPAAAGTPGAAGEPEESLAAVAEQARRRLNLVYRLITRPRGSQSPWAGARQLRFTGPQLQDPVGIAAAEDGRLILVDESIPLAAVVEGDGSLSNRMPASDARRPWWGEAGEAYVTSARSVVELQSRARQAFSGPDSDALENITVAGRGLFGNWWLIDDRRLLEFTRAAEYSRTIAGGAGEDLVDFAVDWAGRLHVLDRNADSIDRYSALGDDRAPLVRTDWRRAEALAVDLLGNVYVLDRDAKTVSVYSAAGALLWSIGPVLPGGIELRSPRDLAVDGEGRVYIADRDLRAFLVLE